MSGNGHFWQRRGNYKAEGIVIIVIVVLPADGDDS